MMGASTQFPKDSIVKAQAICDELVQHGFDQEALDRMAELGYSNSNFEMSDEEGREVLEEFYPSEDEPLMVDQPSTLGKLNGNQLNQWHEIATGLRQSVKQV